jgi:hypothetical protein
MPLKPEKIIERSVDSLQKIYAMIVALAISFSIQNLLLNKADNSFTLSISMLDHLPAFLALISMLVPFYHGMNRHFDRCYIEREKEKTVQGALLFDFFVFFFEASILFAAAASIRSGLQTFLFLAILLSVDMLWAWISHLIHFKDENMSTVTTWAWINLCTLVLALSVFFLLQSTDAVKAWMFFILAVARSVLDYRFCWNFYFP